MTTATQTLSEFLLARIAGTIIVGKSLSAVADGETVLLAEAAAGGLSVEFLGASDEGLVRIYRVGSPISPEPSPRHP